MRDNKWTAPWWPSSCGTQWGSATTPLSSRGSPNEQEFAPVGQPSVMDNWLIKPGMAHPPSTVSNLHPDHLLPSLGGRDLPDGSAAPPSSPLLGTPGNRSEDKNIELEIKARQSSRTLPGRTSSSSPGISTILLGRCVKEEEDEIQEGWKIKEEKKKQKTYLLVPEPGASPRSSVPAFSRSSDSSAATSTTSSGTAAASTAPRGRGQGARGTG
jgi:hypothetical protein